MADAIALVDRLARELFLEAVANDQAEDRRWHELTPADREFWRRRALRRVRREAMTE